LPGVWFLKKQTPPREPRRRERRERGRVLLLCAARHFIDDARPDMFNIEILVVIERDGDHVVTFTDRDLHALHTRQGAVPLESDLDLLDRSVGVDEPVESTEVTFHDMADDSGLTTGQLLIGRCHDCTSGAVCCFRKSTERRLIMYYFDSFVNP